MQNKIITTGLPLSEIKKISIEENNEPLVDVVANDKLVLLSSNKFLDTRLRKSVAELLYKSAESLPEGYRMVLVTAYRPFAMQKKLWRRRLLQMGIRQPMRMLFKYSELRKEASRYTAPPGGSSHQCGAAVDVTIETKLGERLDMGTSLDAFGHLRNTHTEKIAIEQKANRKLLYEAMINAGFINYPLEWWHYSYGDRMWAAYSSRERCAYGPL